MLKRGWLLILAGWMLVSLLPAQDRGQWVDFKRNVHNQPYPYIIPQKNYKRVPSWQAVKERIEARKQGGLNYGLKRFTPPPRRQGRGPRWDRDITNAPSDELHPFFTPDLRFLYLASNALQADSKGRLSGVGTAYHIWRVDVEGEAAQKITGDVADEANGDQIEPALNLNGSLLAYANRPVAGSGNYNIVVRNLANGARVLITNDRFENRHPSFNPAGDLIVFSSNREGGQFRLYLARSDGRPFDDGSRYQVLTRPPSGANDLDPAWSPDGKTIAFTRTEPSGESHIWFIVYDTRLETQWTTYPGARDKQPAWSRDAETLIFASTRKANNRAEVTSYLGSTFDLFRMDTDRVTPFPEDHDNGINQPRIITLDPSNPGAEYPTSAIEDNHVAYQSARPNDTNTQGPHDIWDTLIFDVTAPTLEELPQITPRLQIPGSPVKVRARITDFQSGVEAVYAQFKDPDSAEQDSDHLEHRIYLLVGVIPLVENAPLDVFMEIGQQAVHPDTFEYKDPYVLNPFGFTGSLDDALQLFDDGPASRGGHEPEGETANDGWYTAEWKATPPSPSDFYLDIIVRDKAGNEWVYDNIWGFSTKPFDGMNPVLLILDYGAGQFFVQNRGLVIGGRAIRPTWMPVESYWTDNPTGKYPYDLTSDGRPVIGDGSFASPRVNGARIRADTLGINTAFYAPPALYDIWRVQCRDPISPAVLAGYLPREVSEVVDLSGTTRMKKVWERSVIWASPYTGDVWAGKGHLLDAEVQTALQNFLSAGGRMFISGQDIAWALTLKGGISSQFLAQFLRASFDSDTAEDTFASPYDAMRHILQGVTPSEGDPNPIATNLGLPECWCRWESTTYICDVQPFSDLQLAHPAVFQQLDDGTIIVYGFLAPVSNPNPPYPQDAAWNQVWLDTVSVNPTDRAPYFYTNKGALGDSDRAGFYYSDASTGSRVTYLSFGLEGIHSGYQDTSWFDIPVVWCHAFRSKVLYNGAFRWVTQATLEGVVKEYDPEKQTYKPLPRALVRVIGGYPPSIAGQTVGSAITDSQGFYRIVGLEAPGGYLVDAERPGYRVQHPVAFATCDPGTYTRNLVMLKVPPGSIKGRVVDINGKPVHGATVTAVALKSTLTGNECDPSNELNDPEIPPLTTTTDPDGTFLLPRVITGKWKVTADGSQIGFELGSQPPCQVVDVQPAQEISVPQDFVLLPKRGTLKGKVTNADTNLPIANAQVVAQSGGVREQTTTDQNGNYTLNPPAGSYSVTVTARGYESKTLSAEVRAEEETVLNIALKPLPPGSIAGFVKLQRRRNEGVPGVKVELRLPDTNALVKETTTDQNGKYTFTNVPVGDYKLRARLSGYTIKPEEQTVTVVSNVETTASDFLAEPLRTFFTGLSLVSAPYNYTKDIGDLLNVPSRDRGTSNFRFFTWQEGRGRFIFYPEELAKRFALGRGYFLDTVRDLDLAEEGQPWDENRDFQIGLKPGWNLIGTPFRFSIRWTETKVIDPDTGNPISNAEAVRKGLIANSLWEYVFGQYQPVQIMEPWLGYWLLAYRETTLIIPPTARSRAMKSRALPATSGGEWRLALVASAGDLRDRVEIGASRAATDGFDNPFDLLKPPPLGERYLYLSIPHPEWGPFGSRYGVDIRNQSRAGSWEFTVETNLANTEVTLRWPHLQRIARPVNPVLVDLQTQARRYLRTSSAYTFRTGAQGGAYRFRIEMGAISGLLRITNVQVQRGGRGVAGPYTISFTLTREAQVEVHIVANGRRVRTLFNRASRSAEIQQVVWDGRDQRGIALPPGQYTVEIRATSPQDGQTARSVIPVMLMR